MIRHAPTAAQIMVMVEVPQAWKESYLGVASVFYRAKEGIGPSSGTCPTLWLKPQLHLDRLLHFATTHLM